MSVKSQALRATFNGIKYAEGALEQFRNVKFAVIESRWALPSIIRTFNGAEIDNTLHGPACPQPSSDFLADYSIPTEIQAVYSPKYDELNCLNLMITRPSIDYSSKQKKLPVAVYVHGGGNLTGSASSPMYDASGIILKSIELQKPLIFVHLQYRLGPFGWLAVGGKGNLGLFDIRKGLEWVHDYIEEFGGDKDNVTLFGLSAGGINTFYQAIAPGASSLFRRIGCLSGVARTSAMLAPHYHQRFVKEVVEAANVASEDELRHISADRLLKAALDAGQFIGRGQDDGDFLGSKWNPKKFPTWVESAFISDTKDEGELFYDNIRAKSANYLRNLFETSDPLVVKLKEAYSIDDVTDSQLHDVMLKILADFMFSEPANEMCQAFYEANRPVYRMVFDVHSPFDDSRMSHHAVDLLYMFHYNHKLDSRFLKVVSSLQQAWVEFINGNAPWDPTSVRHYADPSTIEDIPLSKLADARRLDKYHVFQTTSLEQQLKFIKALL